jgi:hypothetical protein
LIADHELFAFERKFNGLAFDNMSNAEIADTIFATIQLPDGTVSSVGFWVYPAPVAKPDDLSTAVSVVLLANESYFEIRSGRAAVREQHRANLVRHTYSEIISKAGSHCQED